MWSSMEERRKSIVMMLNFDWYPDETVPVTVHSYFTEETCEKKKYEHVKELCMHVKL